MKNKLRHESLQQVKSLKRRIATMQNCEMHDTVLLTNAENSNYSNQASLDAEPHPSPHLQTGIAMKSTSGSPAGALLAVQQVQATAARQAAQHIISGNYSKVNPVVSPNIGVMSVQPQQMASPSHQFLHHPAQTLSPHQHLSAETTRISVSDQMTRNNETMLNPPTNAVSLRPGIAKELHSPTNQESGSSPRDNTNLQAWQHLIQILKLPSSVQKNQQVTVFLNANPQLIDRFKRLMTALQRRQQQQLQQQQHHQLQQQQQEEQQ